MSYFLARKEICNLRHPMNSRHPVSNRWRKCIECRKQRKRALWLVALLRKETCNLGCLENGIPCIFIGCFKLQVSFRKRAINYRALLRKMTTLYQLSGVCVCVCVCVCVSVRLNLCSKLKNSWFCENFCSYQLSGVCVSVCLCLCQREAQFV